MIEKWFPTLVYTDESSTLDHAPMVERVYQVMDSLQGHETQWMCDTFSSFEAYDLRIDRAFDTLIAQTKEHVRTFAKEYGVTKSLVYCTEAWFNVARPGNYQEYHTHANNHFSATYYLRTPEGGGDLVFKSYHDDMFTLPKDEETYVSQSYKVEKVTEGKTCIFRSSLPHMVTKNTSSEDRISIAMNFTMIRGQR
jgi:uncharacterized protein (TIGR02466 family)